MAQLPRVEKQNEAGTEQNYFAEIDANHAQLDGIPMRCFNSDARLIERVDFDELLFAHIHHIEGENGALIVVMVLNFIDIQTLELDEVVIVNIYAEAKTLEDGRHRFALSAIAIDLQIWFE